MRVHTHTTPRAWGVGRLAYHHVHEEYNERHYDDGAATQHGERNHDVAVEAEQHAQVEQVEEVREVLDAALEQRLVHLGQQLSHHEEGEEPLAQSERALELLTEEFALGVPRDVAHLVRARDLAVGIQEHEAELREELEEEADLKM